MENSITEHTSRHVHVPEGAGCREQILIAEDLTNKLNALVQGGVKRIEVRWIELPDLTNDPLNRGYRILASRNLLDCGMDNVLAWKLGEIASDPQLKSGGDLIDRGLVLRRLLEEKGFGVVRI